MLHFLTEVSRHGEMVALKGCLFFPLFLVSFVCVCVWECARGRIVKLTRSLHSTYFFVWGRSGVQVPLG